MSQKRDRQFTLYDYTIADIRRLDVTTPAERDGPERESRVLEGGRWVDGDGLSPEEFGRWMLARYLSRRRPALGEEDVKYLRVHTVALASWQKPPLFVEEEQLKALRGIRDRLGWTVRLPRSRVLAGPLNSLRSEFGDEFFNFPEFMGKRPPGDGTKLSGFVILTFREPGERYADFDVQFFAVGSPNRIEWGGGQIYTFFRNRALPVPPWVPALPKENRGRLDLVTGEVKDIRISSIFQSSTIGQVDRVNRVAFAFPFTFPPLPVPPPPGAKPPTPEASIHFTLDGDGRITGMNLSSKSLAFVTQFPFIPPGQSPFQPFSFAPGGVFYFTNPHECKPGTEVCPTDKDNPDGIGLPREAFFHPHLDLVVDRLEELPGPPPPPPCAPAPVADAVLVSAAGRLVLLGGETAQGVGDAVWLLGPRLDRWTAGAPLPTGVTAAQGAARGDEVFVFGGRTADSRQPCGLTQILDLGTGSWREGAELPLAVAAGTAAAVGERVYVIGGVAGNNQTQRAVQVYDPSDDSWSEGSPLPEPLAEVAATVRDGEIFVLGGRTTASRFSDRVWIYDPVKDTWRKGVRAVRGTPEGELPAVAGAVAATIGGTVYRVGGREAREGPTLAASHHFDHDQGELWTAGLDAVLPVAWAAGAELGGALFMVGGRAQTGPEEPPGELSDVVQVFRPGLPWAACDGPIIAAADVMNAAALRVGSGFLSPGCLALVLGKNLGREAGELAITVGGRAAPVLAGLPINGHPLVDDGFFFLVPEVEAGLVPFELTRAGASGGTAKVRVAVKPTAPGLFIYSFLEAREPGFLDRAPALACNEDGTVNCAKQPVVPGQRLTLFATGLGTGGPEEITRELEVRVGERAKRAKVLGVEPASGLPPGIYLVHIEIPARAERSHNVPVTARLGETSNRAVISIQEEAFRVDPPIPCEVGVRAVFPAPPE